MTEKRFTYYKSEITGLYVITDEKHKETFSGMENKYNCNRIVRLLNTQEERIQELEQELKRCREWINSDKNDYELTLAFIKNKGFSLQDVLNYEKMKNGDVE